MNYDTPQPTLDQESEDPKIIEQFNNRKLTAVKIRQILSRVRNNPSKSTKRWAWEHI